MHNEKECLKAHIDNLVDKLYKIQFEKTIVNKMQ